MSWLEHLHVDWVAHDFAVNFIERVAHSESLEQVLFQNHFLDVFILGVFQQQRYVKVLFGKAYFLHLTLSNGCWSCSENIQSKFS